MPAVHQHDQLNRLRASEVDQCVERGADGPPRIEHVVDEQDDAIVEIERNVRAAYQRLRPDRLAHQVIAVERDVEGSRRHVAASDLVQLLRNPTGDGHAPLANADEGQVVDAAIALDDLVRDARQRARQAIAVHHDGHRKAS